jgi:predicted transposase YbfD/YdcC
MGKFKKAFRRLRDPRAANAQYPLLEVLFIALSATLCGAQCASDMAVFGRSKEGLLRQFLRLEHGIPSHDTFSRVFRLLDPQAFEQVFRSFMVAFARFNRLDLTGVVAIDGKALRGAYERGQSATPLHMVNAFATQARLALASRKAPGRNEAQGALEILGMLCLKRGIVTADALHCNRRFATAVLKQGADYVLALKENQSKLFDAVVRRFGRAGTRSSAQKVELSTHDRHERRRATIIRDTSIGLANNFPSVAALARITSRRRLRGGRAERPFIRYYLLSKYFPAKKLLQIVRSHWSIENQLHWVLDVVFDEDGNRARKDHAPENFAIIRKLALNLIRTHPAPISMRQKIKRAGWDDAFLIGVLSHMR